MFETKLKIQKKWTNTRLQKSRDKTAQQVIETSFFSVVTKVLLKLLLLSFFSLIILMPFFFMIFVALMSEDQSNMLKTSFQFFPTDGLHWENFQRAANVKYWWSFAITFANVLVSIVLKIFITMLAGYAFSLKTWRGKEILWSFLIGLLVLPEVALLSGQYQVIKQLPKDFTETFIGIVFVIAVPFVASIFNALMYRNAFEAIPNRIKEVAIVDGAVGWKYLFKIALPMVMPTTLTIVILTALASWNSYLWPALMVPSSHPEFKIMSVWLFDVGREEIGGTVIIYQNVKMAGSIFAILPMFILYFLFRKRIMGSISRQGSTIKG